jgi:hydrogenase-4 component B
MTAAFDVMVVGYVAGVCASAVAPSQRAARLLTAVGAVTGSGGGLLAALAVLASARPLDVTAAGLVSAAGGLMIHIDRLGAMFLALVSAVSLPVAIYGVGYTEVYEGRSMRAFGVMFNSFLLGMSLVPAAGNVFTFLLAWELMAIASYFLVMTESEHVETREAGLWYAAMTHFGFVLLVPMFLLMVPAADATGFADLRAGAAALPAASRSLVFVLAIVAFGSKAGVVPLHVWLPRAHPAAPSHVSALMSGVMIKLGIYGLLRVAVDFLGGGPAWWGGVVLAVGSVSALGGVLYALAENDLKRLLAYSSVENVGVILLGVGAGLVLQSYGLHALALAGFAAALLHTINHAAFKALLFLAAGNVLRQAHTRDMEQMGGLIRGMPHTAALFLVGSAAAAALPPLNGFASKWLVFQSLLSGAEIPRAEVAIGAPLAVGVLALTSGLAAACFVKAFGIGFLAMPRSDAAAQAREPHWSARAPLVAFAAACVLFGLAAPQALAVVSTVVADVTPRTPAAGAIDALTVRLLSPTGVAQVSPLLIAVTLVAVAGVVAVVLHRRGLTLRLVDTWGCGRIRQSPRMEYTSSAFAEPLRRIFAELYRPTEDLSISVHPESRHFVRSITYTSQIVPWLEKALYDPVACAARAVSTRVRRLQAGSVHLYLLYIVAALMAALASAWWFE